MRRLVKRWTIEENDDEDDDGDDDDDDEDDTGYYSTNEHHRIMAVMHSSLTSSWRLPHCASSTS